MTEKRSPWGTDHSSRGRSVQVNIGSAGGSGFSWGPWDEEENIDIYVQPAGGGNPTVAGVITYQIFFWKGEAKFSSPVMPLRTGNLKPFSCSARQVQIQFASTGNPGTFLVNVAICKGSGAYQGPQGSFPIWQQSPNASASMSDHGVLATGPGKVFDGTVNVVGFGGATALYLLLFDSIGPGAPAGNTVPLPGGRSLQLTPAAPGVRLFGASSPIEYGTGLLYALSSTPDVYTAPPAGCTCTVDAYCGG